MWRFLQALSLAAACLIPTFVQAEFGDYVDPTFNCPATTTCSPVCVATLADCPIEMLCEEGQQLCLDGSCASVCLDMHEEESSPCAFECAPVACAKVIDTLDNCKAKYGPFYEAEAACGEVELAETTVLWEFTEAGFVVIYTWIILATVLVYGWSAYNQRLAPVENSTKSLELNFTKSGEKEVSRGWQTGYKVHPVGAAINLITLLTLCGIQVLLAWLTIQYYVQQELFAGLKRVFDDEAQVLKAFIATWFVGFFWTFAMKFPYSINSLHHRRCELSEATHVAIAVIDHQNMQETENTFDDTYIQGLRKFFTSFFWCANEVMTFLFSYRMFFGVARSSYGYYRVIPVATDPQDGTRYIMFRFRRYNLVQDKFVPGVVNQVQTIGDIVHNANATSGLTEAQIQATRSLIGENSISMRKPTFIRCLKRELSKPFYTYQTFMVWTWFPLWYYYMAFTWSILIITAALAVSFFQYRNESSLYQITEIVGDVKVIRDGLTKTIPHQQLVPGDVVIVEDGVAFCDMVVVSTKSLLVDESALTGESNYVGKVEIDPSQGNSEEYDTKRHKRSTVFAGTTILENDDTRAIVTKTASFTARGELIRDIYSFSRHRFKFDVEVPIVLAILLFYAITAFVITNRFIKDLFVYGFFYGMFVVGTILPPLLPTVFTVSVGVSDERLARKRVACTNSESILVAGKVTRAFFDKTGTLTKQGLDFLSVRSASDWTGSKGAPDDAMSSGMAVCHTLSRSKAGELVGNPVDKTMFEACGATMNGNVAKAQHGLEMTILKQFDFDHQSMTQSTIVKTADGHIIAYVKGSGETVKPLCVKDSIPSDFDAALRTSAIQGIYQITMAMKVLPPETDASKFLRSDLEIDLVFLGVINFKNSIREETPNVIRQLAEGDVESIMVTGDSILTGIRIARESGIISDCERVLVGGLTEEGTSILWRNEAHEESVLPPLEEMKQTGAVLAISGEAFAAMLAMDVSEAQKLIHQIRVYGRCTPYDKVSVITQFVKQGYVTLMAGDGGNDCGALKTAHVGIALSDAEASIVAPFTSLDKTISSVVDVLLEGRCALASALASYKYMIMYGQVETLLQIICAYFSITFAEWCWVFMDGIWSVSLAFALPLSAAAPKLVPSRPTASILGLQTVSSAVGILLINFLFLVGSLAYLWSQDWFACRMWDSTDVSNVLVIGDNYETEVLFLVGGFQYIHAAAAFNFGYEFRQAWYRNYILAGLVTFFSVMHIYILFVPGEVSCIWRVNCVNEDVRVSVTDDLIPIQNDFNTTVMPENFRWGLFGLMMANAACVILYEFYGVNCIRRHFADKKRVVAAAAEVSSAVTTIMATAEKTPSSEESVTVPAAVL